MKYVSEVHKQGCAGVYLITNCRSNEIYVGVSKNVLSRHKSHLHALRSNTHHCVELQRAVNEFGIDAFSFGLLEAAFGSGLTLRELEQKWLAYYEDQPGLILLNTSKKSNAPCEQVLSEEVVESTTIRTTTSAHRLLKIVSAISGLMQYEVMETLLQREIDNPTLTSNKTT